MSADLVWQIVRNSSAFLVKRDGQQFTRERGNAINVNSQRFSGLANPKAATAGLTDKGFVVTTKKRRNAAKPKQAFTQIKLNRGIAKAQKSVRAELAAKFYRPDLASAVAARVSRLASVRRAAAKKQ